MEEEIKAGGESSWRQGDCKPNRTRTKRVVIGNVHRSLNAGHCENYTQSVTDRARKQDILAKRKNTKTGLPFYRGWLRSLTGQVDFGWALWKTKKNSHLFSESKELSPRRVLDSGGNLQGNRL
ncbi:hypothetical protein pdam_00025782 [Pocillopora damicornis]|uniref:Uncharacterized protein n=1 Tax=Pocillopora damicornis TaxID=46731 RepID=A0A3M6UKC3_POCDA|nr:hypothetical protein pdam_00025782 [Pocillopora damicornis]